MLDENVFAFQKTFFSVTKIFLTFGMATLAFFSPHCAGGIWER